MGTCGLWPLFKTAQLSILSYNFFFLLKTVSRVLFQVRTPAISLLSSDLILLWGALRQLLYLDYFIYSSQYLSRGGVR